MGGSDQWGNIVNGIELSRRRRRDRAIVWRDHAADHDTADGGKMGKTASGAVWLNADQLLALRLLAVLAQHRGRDVGAFPALFTICRSTRSPGSKRSKARRSTRRRRSWRPKPPRCAMAARPPSKLRPRPRGRPSRKAPGRRRPALARPCRARSSRPGLGVLKALVVKAGLACSERRCAAADPRAAAIKCERRGRWPTRSLQLDAKRP
jgi:hypothetical protein